MRFQASFSAVGVVALLGLSDGGWRNTIAPDAQFALTPKQGLCRSEVTLSETFQRYDFFGAQANAAGTSLRQRLLVSTDYQGQQRRFTGQTDWHIEWRACFETQGDGCRIGGVTSTVNVTYTLPRWVDQQSAPPQLRARWERYIASLTAHERGHGAIAHEVARQIETALVGLSEPAGCDVLNERSVHVVDEVMNRGELQQREYDRVTGHGTSQGAQFPF